MNDNNELEPCTRLREALDSPAFARLSEGERTRIQAEVAEVAAKYRANARLAAGAELLAVAQSSTN